MATLVDQKNWVKFLDDNFDELLNSLNLTNQVIHHLRRESVISPLEGQTLVSINEAKTLERADHFLSILRGDVGSVHYFRQLVCVLQIRAYRCLSAASLFRDFAKNHLGMTTTDWILHEEDCQDGSSALFTKPSQMPVDINLTFIGSFNFAASLPSDHLPRPIDINQIRIKLNDTKCNGNPAAPKVAIISGIGGTGKSTLARLFTLDLQNRGEVDNVVWVPAEKIDSIVWTFARLAASLFNIKSFTKKNTPLPADRFLPQLYQKLFQGRTLIIFDNTLGMEDLQEFIPSSIMPGQQYRPIILVTSRPRPGNWKLLNNNVLPLGFLDDGSAVDYVMSRLGSYCSDRREAQKLAKFYGNLIIALETSTAAITKTNRDRETGTQPQLYTVSSHLTEVKARQVQLEKQNVEGFIAAVRSFFSKTTLHTIELGTEYQELESCWSVSFDKVEKETDGRLALEVLDLCASVNVDEIPVQLLELIWSPAQTHILSAIRLLEDYSLLAGFEISGRTLGKCVRLHRVLQKIRWKCLETPEAITKVVEKVLKAADSFLPYRDIFVDPDVEALYKCLFRVVPTLEVFAGSDTILQYLAEVIEELWYRFGCVHPIFINCQITDDDPLLKLQYQYVELLSQSVSSPNKLETRICETKQEVSALKTRSSTKKRAKQLLMGKLQLLHYRILRENPICENPICENKVQIDSWQVLLLLSEGPSKPVDYWAIYQCGQYLVESQCSKDNYRSVYAIWDHVKKHGIEKHTDPVTTRYFKEIQVTILRAFLIEGKFGKALRTLEDEISGRHLGYVYAKLEKKMLGDLLACLGDYDASIQMHAQADQIEDIQILKFSPGYFKTYYLTFANGIPDTEYFQRESEDFVNVCATNTEEEQKSYGNYEYLDNYSSLKLVCQLLDPDTDNNVKRCIQSENVFSSARRSFARIETIGHVLGILLDQFKEYSRNGNVSGAKTILEKGLSVISAGCGRHDSLTHWFRYRLGIVLRDQWTSTKDDKLLEEALEAFVSLVAEFNFVRADSNNPFNTFIHKCCHALGTILFHTQDFNLAVQVFYTVLNHRIVIRGKEHQRTLESKFWYGKTLNKLGRNDEAVSVLEEVVRDIGSVSRKSIEILNEAQNLLSTLIN